MNSRIPFLVISFLALFLLPGCDVIVGIFKAGFWTAIILVVLIAALSFYAYRKYIRKD